MRDLGPASFESIILHFFKLPIYIILIWKENYLNTTSQSASRYALVFLNNKCSNHEKTNFRRYRTVGHSGLLVKESRLKERERERELITICYKIVYGHVQTGRIFTLGAYKKFVSSARVFIINLADDFEDLSLPAN